MSRFQKTKMSIVVRYDTLGSSAATTYMRAAAARNMVAARLLRSVSPAMSTTLSKRWPLRGVCGGRASMGRGHGRGSSVASERAQGR
jgi:hypothetical protein